MSIWGSSSKPGSLGEGGCKDRIEREKKRRNKIVWAVIAAVLAMVLLAVGAHALGEWKQEKQEQERIEREKQERLRKELEEEEKLYELGAPRPEPEDYASARTYSRYAYFWTYCNENKELHRECFEQEWEQWKYWDEHPEEYQEYLEEQEREEQRQKELEEYYKNYVPLDPIDPSEEEPPDPYDYTTATGYAGNEEDWFAEHGYEDPYAAAEEYWDDHCYEYEQGEDG